MKSASLLGITLDLIAEVAQPGRFPADARVGRFFRQRRFLGSRDRRTVGDAVYAWLRHFPRAEVLRKVWLREAGATLSAEGTAVARRTAWLVDILALAGARRFVWDFAETLSAARELTWERPEDGTAWTALLEELLAVGPVDADQVDREDRLVVRTDLPAWLATRLAEERGEEEAERLAHHLTQPATVDLRVNLRLTTRETARKALERELKSPVAPTPWSPQGIRLTRRANLAGTQVNRRGWIEVADEGSQIVVQCLDVHPGMTVIDACAGAGGKTLALADRMFQKFDGADDKAAKRDSSNSGTQDAAQPLEVWEKTRLIACDVSADKLRELQRRAADVDLADRISIVELRRDGQLPRQLPAADVVLVDAPCSGLGTLRRNPDLKLRYKERDMDHFGRLQRQILSRFAPLVKPGGRLAYVTCSILTVENEDVAWAFAAGHPQFELQFPEWAVRLPGACRQGDFLRVDPELTQTDGFFMALWRRVSESEVDPEV